MCPRRWEKSGAVSFANCLLGHPLVVLCGPRRRPRRSRERSPLNLDGIRALAEEKCEKERRSCRSKTTASHRATLMKEGALLAASLTLPP